MHQTSTQSKMKASTIPMTCIWCHLAAGTGPWESSQKTAGTKSASAVPTTNITAGWKNNYHHVICGDIRKNCYHCFICAAIWGWTAIAPWSVVISGRAASYHYFICGQRRWSSTGHLLHSVSSPGRTRLYTISMEMRVLEIQKLQSSQNCLRSKLSSGRDHTPGRDIKTKTVRGGLCQ